jgi:hypothetical protein
VFCEQCGNDIDQGSRFCAHCGSLVDQEPPPEGSEADGRQGPAESPAAAAAAVNQDASAATTPDPPRPPVWVLPDADASPPSPSGFGGDTFVSKRNKVSAPAMAAYVGGAILASIGIYLATITRITTNLITGQTSTSNPDLGIGVALIVVGVLAAGAGKLAAKQQLRA